MLKKEDLKRIGYSYFVNLLDVHTKNGLKEVKSLNLKTDEELFVIHEDLRKISLFFNNDFSVINIYLNHLFDIDLIAKKISNKEPLTIVEVFDMKKYLINTLNIINEIKTLDISFTLDNPGHLIDYLNENNTITNDFYIYNKYDDELFEVRELKQKLEKEYLEEHDPLLKQNILEERSKIVKAEKIIEYRCLVDITEVLSNNIDVILRIVKNVEMLDLMIAKVKITKHFQTSLPSFNQGISFKEILNPLLSKLVNDLGHDYQEIDIELESTVNLLTGANMGGKSSAMDTLLLNVILARSGFYTFSKEANVPYIRTIHFMYSKGANQSHGLSSFGNELIEIDKILKNSDKFDFVVVDEFAQTTNPKEGRLFVKALINILKEKKCSSFISSHYDNISQEVNHYQVIGIKENITNMKEIEHISKYMDYSILKTNSKKTPKQAITIANILLEDSDLLNQLEILIRSEKNES
ncbi:hypothetical protein CI105_05125 [Candidatus Izimaplasma bacterium ZiA1]|uniref:lysine 5,6-aminomutase reactivase ATPase KamC n=1 Tax=Candidatus Izimoplasma sp. ZiA1 TaxID=2024899 RepID=UPI000BAA4EF8|nr:hypothetical protein CI105_05125 [Candidatus Izimaplasma bacterium ZiA1]